MGTHATVRTHTLAGVEAIPVDVEVDVGPGLPSFSIVGLPDLAVQEARERVRSAIRACGYELPNSRIVVNLAPGPLRKHGTGFDLPIALGLLVATRQLAASAVGEAVAVGELSLDGAVRPVPGILAHALAARRAGLRLIGPARSADVAALDGLDFRGLGSLGGLRVEGAPVHASRLKQTAATPSGQPDFSEVYGQSFGVRALLIAAAGGHNVLMVGPPGSGKTMLARRLPTILPPLVDDERLETALVHSVAGLDEAPAMAGVRPFRAPHHSSSVAGLVGGGSPPRPGEASLAHNGVLFLDEMPEFGPAALQALRQPLEDGSITLVRSEGRLRFPSSFALVGAANPCPCGFLGDPVRPCRCPAHVVSRYASRIGGPLMDRIDLVIRVDRPDPAVIMDAAPEESSERLRVRAIEVRERAERRGGRTSAIGGAELLDACALDEPARCEVERAAQRHHLSGRGITRLLRVARTVADLERQDRVRVQHVLEALAYRAQAAT